ncbi:hypothetical protein PQR05_03920 [Paraburkholderia sediminicola]|uniref:hypothetical protein n=1 Tax=Paraburkholderia sediminicola TaxID=458836 RepID=UPI0038BD7294
MKLHSLEGLKQKAQRYTCAVFCDELEAAQRVQGVTVVVESVPVTCLYDSPTDSFLWIVSGQFVHEDEVRAFLDEGRPPPIPKEISTREALEKFDRYRAAQMPVISTHEQTGGREQYETICRLNEAWLTRYTGPEGYERIVGMLDRGGGALPPKMLAERADAAEAGLFDVAERFMAEYARLGMQTAGGANA